MTAGRSVEPFRRRAAWWFAWWVALMALWMVLVATTALAEVLAGVAASALAAGAAEVVREQRLAPIRLALRPLLRAWRLPVRTVREFGLAMAELSRKARAPRGSRGRFVAVPFDVGPRSPRGTARRAVMAAAGSLAPNTYVLGFDRDEGVVLVHQLAPEDPEAVVRKLRGLT